MLEFIHALGEILKAIVFGIIEGITEWLPISSTGHLILINELLKLDVSPEFYEMFQVVIQLGAILAVIVLFLEKLNPFSEKKDARQKERTWSLWFKVVAAVLPSAVLGVLFDDLLDTYLYNYVVVALMLIVYGVAFLFVENRNGDAEPKIKGVHGIDMKTALLIGCFQCLSLIPGTSRSGATILGGILLGVSRSGASEFSFFLAIPTMLGASLLKFVKFLFEGVSVGFLEILILLVGCVTAYFVSMLVIRGLMDYVRKHDFKFFGFYRIGLGALVLVYALVKGIIALIGG